MITLVHLYPREMNIYGDTGNVRVLAQRLAWRGYESRVLPVNVGDPLPSEADIVLGGGGQDAAQGEIGLDFVSKAATLTAMAADGVVMLAICGSYQLLGHEFVTQDGVRIPGIGLLDVTTRASTSRLIGNISVDTDAPPKVSTNRLGADGLVAGASGRPAAPLGVGRLVGYENHSGLTTLGPAARPIGATAHGRGNNGTDRSEGAMRDNVFGTYLHGPVLAKSPRFADELLRRVLTRRGIHAPLEPLDDRLADQAARVALSRPR